MWRFVPEDAAAVRLTDEDGSTSWQRPGDRIVILPDTVDDPDEKCRCSPIDAEGDVIVSVDVDTGVYVDG